MRVWRRASRYQDYDGDAPREDGILTEGKKDVDAVYRAFRDAVAREVREDDVSTHFDLGIAYAEMGMVSDAISEFELVLTHDPNHVQARAKLEVLRAKLT